MLSLKKTEIIGHIFQVFLENETDTNIQHMYRVQKHKGPVRSIVSFKDTELSKNPAAFTISFKEVNLVEAWSR